MYKKYTILLHRIKLALLMRKKNLKKIIPFSFRISCYQSICHILEERLSTKPVNELAAEIRIIPTCFPTLGRNISLTSLWCKFNLYTLGTIKPSPPLSPPTPSSPHHLHHHYHHHHLSHFQHLLRHQHNRYHHHHHHPYKAVSKKKKLNETNK